MDASGLLEDVNMIIATGQNNLAMNETVLQIAQEGANRIELRHVDLVGL